MILYQLVLLPPLLVLTWLYIALRPASGRGPAMTAFDAAVILAASVSSAAAGWWASVVEPAPEGSIWSIVMTTVSIFHVFPAVLMAGWLLRRRIFRA